MPNRTFFSRKGGFSQIATDYRSGLEESIQRQLDDAGIPFTYEKHKITYQIPATTHTYTPDFVLPNGIIIEGKGIFDSADRKKHLLVKKQYPNLDIRFVFSNAKQKIYKGSNTTYGMWCEKNKIKYATKYIPLEWLKETNRNTEGLQAK